MWNVFLFSIASLPGTVQAGELPERCRAGLKAEAPISCVDHATVSPIGNLADALKAFHQTPAMTGSTTRIEPGNTKYFAPVSLKAGEARESDVPFVDTGAPLAGCQTMRGYGFGLTSSTVLNYERLPPKYRRDVMRKLFSPTEGANLTYLVLPMSTTDFNGPDEADFSVCDCKGKTPDPKSHCFDGSRLEHQIKFLLEAKRWNPGIKVMLKPWSPPPHMKQAETVNGKTPYRGGKFNIEWAESLGSCLADAARYLQKRGIKVQSVAAQNEPGIQMPYPSVYMDEASQARVLDEVYRDLHREMPHIQMVLRSDNFNSAHEVVKTKNLMKSGAKNLVFAAHCYSGPVEPAYQALPASEIAFCGGEDTIEYMLGECTGHTSLSDWDFAWWMENRIMTDTAMGATGTISWNGILDEKHGPKSGGCEQCRGLATTDFSRTNDNVAWNPEFYAINHLSRYVQNGAKRLMIEEKNETGVRQLLFRNPDGTKVGLFFNGSDKPKTFRVITADCRESELTMEPHSATTLQWD